MSESIRERVVQLCREMRGNTVANGCTPGEASKFSAKVAELVEKYQIEEAELKVSSGAGADAEMEVCENLLRTGKKAFNPGMTMVVNGLAMGMCCKVILLHQGGEAVYGITGEVVDVDYVCQIATSVVPALQVMAALEGREHGYEKAGLVQWSNQYLMGAGYEIQQRLEADRKERSDAKEAQHKLGGPCTALALITGETLAVVKRAAVAEVFHDKYPRTRTSRSHTEYNHTANQAGREAGKRVGLNRQIGG